MKNKTLLILILFSLLLTHKSQAGMWQNIVDWWDKSFFKPTSYLKNKATQAALWTKDKAHLIPIKYKVGAAIAGTGALGLFYLVRMRKDIKNPSSSKEIATSNSTFTHNGSTYKIDDTVLIHPEKIHSVTIETINVNAIDQNQSFFTVKHNPTKYYYRRDKIIMYKT